MRRASCTLLLLAIAGGSAAAPAVPAPVVSSHVEWALTITPDPGVAITLDPHFGSTSSVNALANGDFDSAFLPAALAPLSATAADSFASAGVAINGTTAVPDAEGTLDAQAASGSASGSTLQNANFLVGGSGNITFDLSYALSATIDPGAGDGASVLSRLSLGINIGDNGVFTETGLGATIAQASTSSEPNSGSWGLTDSTQLIFAFDEATGNDAFFIDLSALASASSALSAVPLPPGLPLLGLIAPGLLLLRRRP